MPLIPTVVVTANLQQITGSPDAAKATFELVGFGSTVPRVSGSAVIVQTATTATADGSGNISVTIWGLDVITPAACFYTVTFYNDIGGVVASLAYDAFVGSGNFDLSQVVPMGQIVVAPPQPTSAIPQIFTPLSHQFLTGMNSSGLFSSARPSAADLSDTATTGNVLRGNGTSFVSAILSFGDLSGTVTAAQLPLPTASTLGGVKSLAAIAHNFLTSIGTNGLPVAAQPAFSDISGTAAASQLPNPSATTLGGIESLAAQSSKWINAISTLGVPSATQPAFTDISGTASTGQIPNLSATIITSGLLALAHGGTNADLSATGAAHQVLKQSSVGAAITVGQLAAADLSDGTTGSGAVVLANTPTLITPILGVAAATSINKVAITAPATSATLTILNGKTLTANNTLTLAGTDSTTMTFPTTTATIARTDAGQTFTGVQVVSSPTINGTPTGTGIPTITFKKGTGAGNYTSASTSDVVVDGTNLVATITIPTGWKLVVFVSGSITSLTATATVFVGIADGGTTIYTQPIFPPTNATNFSTFSFVWEINGDGAAHTIDLRYHTGVGADSVSINNGASNQVPTMVFFLTPAN